MKPNDDERRVAAERLRAVEWAHEDELARKIEEAVGCGIGQDWEDMGVVDRLSELIEPEPERTCRPVARYRYDDSSPWPYLVCSECGEKLSCRDVVTEHGEESCEMLPYCAGCGAEVVGE